MPGKMTELEQYIKKQQDETEVHTPVLYYLDQQKDYEALTALLAKNPNIRVYDQIYSQLRELMKIRNPTRKLTPEEYEETVREYIGDTPIYAFGVWVYYPWTERLVHIVDQDDFIELRTSRNKEKITDEEITLLKSRKIGIIGLSVGQSIALTLAMERVCGELRLADFDKVELTNMNRIRTGIHSIQVSKVIVAAREIAELDPFIKVVTYMDGATEGNLDDFFTKGGNLDILVEECDGLDIKILSRVKAKALGIPVVMDTNDRGMVDVERFDLEPDRPLLHGFIPDVDLKHLQGLSDAEKLPILRPMVAIDDMSARMKYSLGQIGKTITTWPQLASSVVLGGAVVTDTCRRILLDQLKSSGRYYVDFEQIIV